MSKRKKPEKKEISQGWLTTYSDMMTLVLTFFVLLYSYSLVDIEKFKKVSQSMNTAFGGGAGIFELNKPSGDAPIVGDKTPKGQDDKGMYETVVDFVNQNELSEYVKIREDKRGVIMEFNNSILFDTGKTDLKPDSVPIMDKVAVLLDEFPNNVIVEGHTDNVPIHYANFPSNWELSASRATTVLRYLVEKKGVKPERLTAVACGEYSPIASNNTPEGRAKNRRVNILIVTKDKESNK